MSRIANATTELEEHGEIEVTPEMIRAGMRELALCESGDAPASTVEAIYRAMRTAQQADAVPP
jgi:hypothetical protein